MILRIFDFYNDAFSYAIQHPLTVVYCSDLNRFYICVSRGDHLAGMFRTAFNKPGSSEFYEEASEFFSNCKEFYLDA